MQLSGQRTCRERRAQGRLERAKERAWCVQACKSARRKCNPTAHVLLQGAPEGGLRGQNRGLARLWCAQACKRTRRQCNPTAHVLLQGAPKGGGLRRQKEGFARLQMQTTERPCRRNHACRKWCRWLYVFSCWIHVL